MLACAVDALVGCDSLLLLHAYVFLQQRGVDKHLGEFVQMDWLFVYLEGVSIGSDRGSVDQFAETRLARVYVVDAYGV